MADINEFYLADLSWRIASRELSSSEVVDAALARLERMQAKLNAFITVLAEPAIAEAKRADEEIARGRPRGPLHGVPVTIKDMFETAGVLTTGGSKILADWVPTTDSHLVERLRAAGAIIIGKDESRRVRPRRHVDAFPLRSGPQSVECRSHRRRIERRLRCRGGCLHRAAFLRHRDGIVGAPAGILLWDHRLQADVRHH